MTLGSETAAVLMRAMDMLHHQTSSGQHALLCADERRCALQQLLATVEAASKLAEVALAAEHNAAGRDVEHVRVEKEKLQVDAVKIGKEVERAMVETVRLRMEGEKVRVEVERATQEMEKARVELETVRCEIEQHAETERLSAAASCKPPETHSLSPSRSLPVQIHPAPSPVERAPLSALITIIVGLYATNHMVEEITAAVGKWNNSNNDQYTPAGWAWFKHSETRAFVFMAAPGTSEVSWAVEARKRTAPVNFGRHFFSSLELSRGYGGFIYGGRNESGERDRVAFKAVF